jgi:hypothetical protein
LEYVVGYYTRLSSTLKVTPRQDIPEGWEDFINHGFYGNLAFDSIHVEVLEDEAKTYDIDAELQDLVDKLPNAAWSGYIEGVGEEYPDVWRLYVYGGMVHKVTPKITWPEPGEEMMWS